MKWGPVVRSVRVEGGRRRAQATQLVPKTKAGGENSFAVFQDPQGAVFALFEGFLDD